MAAKEHVGDSPKKEEKPSEKMKENGVVEKEAPKPQIEEEKPSEKMKENGVVEKEAPKPQIEEEKPFEKMKENGVVEKEAPKPQIEEEKPSEKMKENGVVEKEAVVNVDNAKVEGEEKKQNENGCQDENGARPSTSLSDSGDEREIGQEIDKGEQRSSPLSTDETRIAKNEVVCSSPSCDAMPYGVESYNAGFLSELKEHERKAFLEMRSIVDKAILSNKLFQVKKEDKSMELRSIIDKVILVNRLFEVKKETEKKEEPEKESEKKEEPKMETEKKEEPKMETEITDHKEEEEEEEEEELNKEEGGNVNVDKGKEKVDEYKEEQEKRKHSDGNDDKDMYTLWGVPLLPSKGDKRTDDLLLKFLRAREFKVNDALEMLRNTLRWRKENNMDSIMDEDFGNEYDSVAYVSGSSRGGHPICYNVYGVFDNNEMYNKTLGTEASRERFLRWRLQMMEKQIQLLNFEPDGVSSLIQVNDLKNTPGPSRRDLRLATRRAVEMLQDNYPEFVARNIFINVPFWYYAFNAILSPFLTQRTKSKFVFSRPSRVTETLLKYIAAEKIPVKYGGLRRDDDTEFSTKDAASEIFVRAGATEIIEIPVAEVGKTLIWDLTVIGWDVNYKEEFVPKEECSYTLIVKKGRKISFQEEPIRNTFKNNEPGKLVITIENGMFKKKHVLYRYKTCNSSASSSK